MNHLDALDMAASLAAQVDPHATKSNPRVGCVVIENGHIIGQGAHEKFGEAHAEVKALTSLANPNLSNAVVYITLEPCVHTPHKKTPACTSLLTQRRPRKVIIGCLDPHFPGQGVRQLETHGIEVEVLNTSHHEHLNPWFKNWITQQEPFIRLKVGQSLDGKITPPLTSYQKGERALTGAQTKIAVHNLRAHHQALLTSTQTILEDDPLLDVRHAKGLSFTPSAPDIIIAGTRAIPKNARVFSVPNRQVHFISDLDALVPYCQTNKIASVMTECGGQLNSALLASDLVDKIEIFTAPIFCGATAKPSFIEENALNNFQLSGAKTLGRDIHLSFI